MKRSRGSNQFKSKKHPLMPAKAVAQIYLTIVTAVILMSLYQKTTRIQEAQAEHFVSPVRTMAAGISATPAVSAALPTPTPTVIVYTPTQEKVITLIKKIWKKDATVGIKIATCESHLNADAVGHNDNNTEDLGPMQINSIHGYKLDPEENISYAYSLYTQQGATPWASSNGCHHLLDN